MNTRSRRALRGLGTLGILGLVIGMLPADAPAGSETRKVRKQIRVFEAMVDQMLVDSPNWLVQSRNEARGSYVSGDGVVVSFDASLVGGKCCGDHWWNFWSDDHVIIIEGDEKWDKDDEKKVKKSKDWHERHLSKQERLYQRGKAEMIDTILDFGDVLTFLKDDEWLELEADLHGAAWFEEKDLDRLTMRVQMKDVRAYAEGKYDEKKLVEKIQVKES